MGPIGGRVILEPMFGPIGASWEGQEERAQLNGGAEPRLQGRRPPAKRSTSWGRPSQPLVGTCAGQPPLTCR